MPCFDVLYCLFELLLYVDVCLHASRRQGAALSIQNALFVFTSVFTEIWCGFTVYVMFSTV